MITSQPLLYFKLESGLIVNKNAWVDILQNGIYKIKAVDLLFILVAIISNLISLHQI